MWINTRIWVSVCARGYTLICYINYRIIRLSRCNSITTFSTLLSIYYRSIFRVREKQVILEYIGHINYNYQASRFNCSRCPKYFCYLKVEKAPIVRNLINGLILMPVNYPFCAFFKNVFHSDLYRVSAITVLESYSRYFIKRLIGHSITCGAYANDKVVPICEKWPNADNFS